MPKGMGARVARRYVPPLARYTSCAFAAAAASIPIPSPLSVDPEVPAFVGSSLTTRKEQGEPAPALEPGPVPTLATLANLHTGELLPLSEDEPTPERFSEFLEDRGMKSRVAMHPGLLDALRAIARPRQGVRVEIVSGYRSPKRNEMMRKKGRNVASHSQHTLGMAIDIRVEGMRVGELVDALEAMKWEGGIGRYDKKSDLFVHIDLGLRRRWRGK